MPYTQNPTHIMITAPARYILFSQISSDVEMVGFWWNVNLILKMTHTNGLRELMDISSLRKTGFYLEIQCLIRGFFVAC